MKQEIQELSIEEFELVNGSGLEIDPPAAQSNSIDYPVIENNPPG
ncbi:MAG TPA: hypothetical protein VGD52_03750 [Pseudoduganella sp.]